MFYESHDGDKNNKKWEMRKVLLAHSKTHVQFYVGLIITHFSFITYLL